MSERDITLTNGAVIPYEVLRESKTVDADKVVLAAYALVSLVEQQAAWGDAPALGYTITLPILDSLARNPKLASVAKRAYHAVIEAGGIAASASHEEYKRLQREASAVAHTDARYFTREEFLALYPHSLEPEVGERGNS